MEVRIVKLCPLGRHTKLPFLFVISTYRQENIVNSRFIGDRCIISALSCDFSVGSTISKESRCLRESVGIFMNLVFFIFTKQLITFHKACVLFSRSSLSIFAVFV